MKLGRPGTRLSDISAMSYVGRGLGSSQSPFIPTMDMNYGSGCHQELA